MLILNANRPVCGGHHARRLAEEKPRRIAKRANLSAFSSGELTLKRNVLCTKLFSASRMKALFTAKRWREMHLVNSPTNRVSTAIELPSFASLVHCTMCSYLDSRLTCIWSLVSVKTAPVELCNCTVCIAGHTVPVWHCVTHSLCSCNRGLRAVFVSRPVHIDHFQLQNFSQ